MTWSCTAVFRGPECAYAGAETRCDKTSVRCQQLGNFANWRGGPPRVGSDVNAGLLVSCVRCKQRYRAITPLVSRWCVCGGDLQPADGHSLRAVVDPVKF
jgi:hypothetical protein